MPKSATNPFEVFLPLSGSVWQQFRGFGQFGLINFYLTGSQNPQLEGEITTQWSYGRQIGRIHETLKVLIKRLDGALSTEEQAALRDFDSMDNEINKLRKRLEN
ncbi:hypothetical protein GCM10027046_35550 [Uliginosibacterium flavum]|uniref:Uncharacterized protein n=1 Tax=Uliginosibacterium flavum TaxID=1396831 RepID=A0ABV2TQS9_9RHOO